MLGLSNPTLLRDSFPLPLFSCMFTRGWMYSRQLFLSFPISLTSNVKTSTDDIHRPVQFSPLHPSGNYHVSYQFIVLLLFCILFHYYISVLWRYYVIELFLKCFILVYIFDRFQRQRRSWRSGLHWKVRNYFKSHPYANFRISRSSYIFSLVLFPRLLLGIA